MKPTIKTLRLKDSYQDNDNHQSVFCAARKRRVVVNDVALMSTVLKMMVYMARCIPVLWNYKAPCFL